MVVVEFNFNEFQINVANGLNDVSSALRIIYSCKV